MEVTKFRYLDACTFLHIPGSLARYLAYLVGTSYPLLSFRYSFHDMGRPTLHRQAAPPTPSSNIINNNTPALPPRVPNCLHFWFDASHHHHPSFTSKQTSPTLSFPLDGAFMSTAQRF
ncbi:hypothetical protein LX32DRAFT_44203 [Colletotrichum zoysiae]|uniref:Uncharacterized protein n=1 Tax=Colletotrichum zoysiae TaxID=1216348 RepID=A0AAD9HB95_9PEZI|nr:hypothetical protein LX32DRAFT_44203 [Colletotrichum zoysiae]